MVQPSGPYAIAGYSFGALVAFAIVLLLEKETQVASLVMLDGAPKYVKWYITSTKQRLNMKDDQIENSMLALFALLMANIDCDVVLKVFRNIPTWKSKVTKCAEMVENEIHQSLDQVRFKKGLACHKIYSFFDMYIFIPSWQIKTAASFFCMKLMAALKYKPTGKVSCEVTLVKPSENYAKLEEDYGLSEVFLFL